MQNWYFHRKKKNFKQESWKKRLKRIINSIFYKNEILNKKAAILLLMRELQKEFSKYFITSSSLRINCMGIYMFHQWFINNFISEKLKNAKGKKM